MPTDEQNRVILDDGGTAVQVGALQVTIHTTTGGQAGKTDRLLKRRGAELVGGNYGL